MRSDDDTWDDVRSAAMNKFSSESDSEDGTPDYTDTFESDDSSNTDSDPDGAKEGGIIRRQELCTKSMKILSLLGAVSDACRVAMLRMSVVPDMSTPLGRVHHAYAMLALSRASAESAIVVDALRSTVIELVELSGHGAREQVTALKHKLQEKRVKIKQLRSALGAAAVKAGKSRTIITALR